MNRTSTAIVEAFWELLEEKSYHKITVNDIVNRCHVNRNTFYYHFQDIPTLTSDSIQKWVEDVIENRGTFGSTEKVLVYIAEECTKRKKAFLHLYHSVQRDIFLNKFSQMQYAILTAYADSVEQNRALSAKEKEALIRYYKCVSVGIVTDWLDHNAAYDLKDFYEELCVVFQKTDPAFPYRTDQ